MYLLDTNILIQLRKSPDEKLRRQLYEKDPRNCFYSHVTEMELLCGKSPNVLAKTRALLLPFDSLPFDDACALRAAHIVQTHGGLTITTADLQIAGTALAHDFVLVSDDRIFGKIKNIKVENWVR